jgi:ATP-dependent Clp protease ATP-binding subunit ClpB
VMTSNLGSQLIQEFAAHNDYNGMKRAVLEVVQGHFRPEFINRLDEIVVFHPLGREHIRSIAGIQSQHLAKRLSERGIKLDLSDAALDLLGESGFDPVYGARPLKRAIQQQMENPLAREILQGRFVSGDTIVVAVESGRLVFEKA